MENKNKTEPETEVRYDDRRKEMIHSIKQISEIKINDKVVGEVTRDRKSVFKEEGIRDIMKDLSMQRTKLENTIKQIKDSLKKVPEMTPELKKLEKQIQAINDINKNKQSESQLKSQQEDLKSLNKDIRDIKNAIGTRLKL